MSYILQSIRHDDGVYDYVQFDLLGITTNILHCARWGHFENAVKFRHNMQNGDDFRVTSYKGN